MLALPDLMLFEFKQRNGDKLVSKIWHVFFLLCLSIHELCVSAQVCCWHILRKACVPALFSWLHVHVVYKMCHFSFIKLCYILELCYLKERGLLLNSEKYWCCRMTDIWSSMDAAQYAGIHLYLPIVWSS